MGGRDGLLGVHVPAQLAITEEFIERGKQHTARTYLTLLYGPEVIGSFQLRVMVWEQSTVARPPVPEGIQGFSPCGCQLLQCPQLLPEPLLHHAQLLRGLRAPEGLGPLIKFLHGAPMKSQFLFQGLSAHKDPGQTG